MKAAVSCRAKRYENVYSLHIRWENDDTDAERDENSLRSIIKLCGFPSPEVFLLKTAGSPGFELFDRIYNLQKQAFATNQTSLIIIHYAGHGITGEGDELVLATTNGRKRVRTGTIFHILTDESGYLDQSIVDVLLMLDCCYSYLAVRKFNPSSRIVEVIIAGEARDPIAFAAGTRNSFTCKLHMESRSIQQQGKEYAEVAEII
jgi:hypothetical protein